MNLYSIDDADYLINYYKDKIIGKVLEESTQSKITHLDKEHYAENKYRVNAFGTVIKGIFYPKRSIELVLRDLDLELPDAVLSKKTQIR